VLKKAETQVELVKDCTRSLCKHIESFSTIQCLGTTDKSPFNAKEPTKAEGKRVCMEIMQNKAFHSIQKKSRKKAIRMPMDHANEKLLKLKNDITYAQYANQNSPGLLTQ
jgi:hypothetical protein